MGRRAAAKAERAAPAEMGPQTRALVTALSAVVEGNTALRRLRVGGTSLPKVALESLKRTIRMNRRMMAAGDSDDDVDD